MLPSVHSGGKGLSKKGVRSLPGKENINKDILDISVVFVAKAQRVGTLRVEHVKWGMVSDEEAGRNLVNHFKKLKIHPAGNGHLLEVAGKCKV